MSNEKYKNYLSDLVSLTKEYARESIADYIVAKGLEEESYKAAYMLGFHRFITLIQQQANAFDMPLIETGLADINENDFFNSVQCHSKAIALIVFPLRLLCSKIAQKPPLQNYNLRQCYDEEN